MRLIVHHKGFGLLTYHFECSRYSHDCEFQRTEDLQERLESSLGDGIEVKNQRSWRLHISLTRGHIRSSN